MQPGRSLSSKDTGSQRYHMPAAEKTPRALSAQSRQDIASYFLKVSNRLAQYPVMQYGAAAPISSGTRHTVVGPATQKKSGKSQPTASASLSQPSGHPVSPISAPELPRAASPSCSHAFPTHEQMLDGGWKNMLVLLPNNQDILKMPASVVSMLSKEMHEL